MEVNDKIVRAPVNITVSETDRKLAEKEVELQEPVEAKKLRMKEVCYTHFVLSYSFLFCSSLHRPTMIISQIT